MLSRAEVIIAKSPWNDWDAVRLNSLGSTIFIYPNEQDSPTLVSESCTLISDLLFQKIAQLGWDVKVFLIIE